MTSIELHVNTCLLAGTEATLMEGFRAQGHHEDVHTSHIRLIVTNRGNCIASVTSMSRPEISQVAALPIVLGKIVHYQQSFKYTNYQEQLVKNFQHARG